MREECKKGTNKKDWRSLIKRKTTEKEEEKEEFQIRGQEKEVQKGKPGMERFKTKHPFQIQSIWMTKIQPFRNSYSNFPTVQTGSLVPPVLLKTSRYSVVKLLGNQFISCHVPLRHEIAATGTRNRSHHRGTYSLSEFNINKFSNIFFLIQELDDLAKGIPSAS